MHFHFTFLLKWNVNQVLAVRYPVPKMGNAAHHYLWHVNVKCQHWMCSMQ